MPEHIAALVALMATFVVKWCVKWVLLKLHSKGKINTLVTVLACMLVFMVTYTFFHTAAPSAEENTSPLAVSNLYTSHDSQYEAVPRPSSTSDLMEHSRAQPKSRS